MQSIEAYEKERFYNGLKQQTKDKNFSQFLLAPTETYT